MIQGAPELPDNREPARAVLAAALHNDRVPEIISSVAPSDLTHAQDRRVLKAVCDAAEQSHGSGIDALMVKDLLADDTDKCYAGLLLDSHYVRNVNLADKFKRIKDAAWRNGIAHRAQGLIDGVTQNISGTQLGELIEGLQQDQSLSAEPVLITDAEPDFPEFSIENLVQCGALHLWWAPSNVGKTYLMLWLLADLLSQNGRSHFLGHPELRIRRRYKKALLVTAEETTGRARYRWDYVVRGHGQVPDGQLLHIWSAQPGARVYLNDLPALVEKYRPDCVVADPLTALLPREASNSWDVDNIAADDSAMALRGLCGELGVDVHLVHHANASGERERGATAWGNSCDVKVKLGNDNGRIRFEIEKQRDAAKLAPFLVDMDFTGDAVRFEYIGETSAEELRPIDKEVYAYLCGAGPTAQYVICSQIHAHKQTVIKSLQRLESLAMAEKSGKTIKQSPEWEAITGGEGGETRNSPLGNGRTQ